MKRLVFPEALTDFTFAQLVEKVWLTKNQRCPLSYDDSSLIPGLTPWMSQSLITWQLYKDWLNVVLMVKC